MSEYTKQLDLIDLKILSELDKNSKVSSKKLSKIIQKSRSSIDYRINNYLSKGIIVEFVTSLNPSKMGYKLFKFYVCIRNIENRKDDLILYLKNLKSVYWYTECSGSYDLVITFFAKNDYDFFVIKNNLLDSFKDVITSYFIDVIIKVRQYYKSFFLNKIIYSDIYFGGEVVDNKLDSLDYMILEEISNNSRKSNYSISRKLNTTPAIVKNRILRLEKKGIIIQYRINVDLNKLGYEFYKVIIECDGFSEKDYESLLEYVSSKTPVTHFVVQLWRLEIELVTKNYSEFYKFISDLKSSFPNFIKKVDFVLMTNDVFTPGFKNV